MTSEWRRWNVMFASTSMRRHYNVVCLLGIMHQCEDLIRLLELPIRYPFIWIRKKWAATRESSKVEMRPSQTQISLGIRLVWSQSFLSALTVAKDLTWRATFMWTAKTLIRLGGCPGLSESARGTQPLCWFPRVVVQNNDIGSLPTVIANLF